MIGAVGTDLDVDVAVDGRQPTEIVTGTHMDTRACVNRGTGARTTITDERYLIRSEATANRGDHGCKA
jgi:hypothetical protein